MKTRLMLCVAAAIFAAGCNGSNGTIVPPPSQHIYVSDFLNPGTIHIFGPAPISAASTQLGSFAGTNEPVGMRFDSAGRLYVANFSTTATGAIQVFNQPITNGATPAFSITFTGRPEDVALDMAGNLYVADPIGGAVQVFSAPLSSGSTIAYAISNSTASVRGLAFDAAGDLFINNGTNIVEFTPPFSSGSAPHITFGTGGDDHGIAFDTAGNLWVGNGMNMDVYTAPFSNAQTKSFSVVVGAFSDYIAFDRNNNLYVPGEDGKSVRLDAAVLGGQHAGVSHRRLRRTEHTGRRGRSLGRFRACPSERDLRLRVGDLVALHHRRCFIEVVRPHVDVLVELGLRDACGQAFGHEEVQQFAAKTRGAIERP
jgi:streptogramin lyase